MILLRLLSWPYLRKHLFRSLLTIAGIMLGVAVFVGMHSANESVLAGYRRTVDQIAGATQLQITAGESGFDEEVLERVQATPGVRVAAPVIEATMNTGLPGQGNILILAVDMTGDRSLREYDLAGENDDAIDDPLVFLAQPDSLMITTEFAARNKLETNSKLRLRTMEGEKEFTIRGIMKAGGLASAFGGNLAVMDVYAAQKIFGCGRKFDRIDLAVNEGVSVDAVKASLEKALGPGFQVEPPASRGRQFESIAQIHQVGANLNSLFALLIGLFIIYNTFAIAVAQRRTEIGILRALGATRGMIQTLFLGESLVLGLVGSLCGIVLGIAIARGVAGYLGVLLGEVYGVAQRTEDLAISPRVLTFALLIGLATSVIAAWLPSRQAARVDPVKALHKGLNEPIPDHENRLRRWIAFVLAGIAVAFLAFARTQSAAMWASYLLFLVAVILLTPALTIAITRLLRPVLSRVRPVEGALAADSLLQSPRRTSATVTALMLSLSFTIGLAGIARASYTSILTWLNNMLNADFFIGSSEKVTERSFRFPFSMGDELRRIEGVRIVQPVRQLRIEFHGGPVMVVASDLASLAKTTTQKVIAGDARQMYERSVAGKALIVADNLALLHGLKLEDTVELSTPKGPLRLPIAGIVQDYSDQLGTFMIDYSVFRNYWNDDTVNIFRVYKQPDVPREVVKQRILDRLGSRSRLFVMTNEEVRSFVMGITDQWFGMTYLQVLVAVLVAVLGIINSLTVSITDRRRELGVLQAVGGLRNQVRHTIWMEAVATGLVSVLIGIGVGAVVLFYYLETVRISLAGLRLDYAFPFGMALALVPLMLVAAWVSSLAPAESAVRSSLVEALEYE